MTFQTAGRIARSGEREKMSVSRILEPQASRRPDYGLTGITIDIAGTAIFMQRGVEIGGKGCFSGGGVTANINDLVSFIFADLLSEVMPIISIVYVCIANQNRNPHYKNCSFIL
jgi:hypothetical protein